MLRFFLAFVAAVIVSGSAGMSTAAAAPEAPLRSRFDRRVDTIGIQALLHAPPQSLTDPSRQRGARVVTDVQQTLFFFWAIAQIAAFGWLWRSGNAARARDWLKRRMRGRVAVRAGFGAMLGLFAPLAGLPFAFIGYRIDFNVGLTEARIGPWLAHYASGMALDAVATAVVVAVALEFVDRTRLWYLGVIAFLYAVVIGVVALNPVLVPSTACCGGEFRAASVAAAPLIMRRTSAESRVLSARTAGIGPFTVIVLGDALLSAATPDELMYAVAHESAHVRHNDVVKLAAIGTTLLVFACAFAVLISDRIGFRRDDDPVSRLALVGAFIGGVVLVFFPLYNAYARGIEYRADEDARRVLAARAAIPGAVRLLVRAADDNMLTLCYRRSSSWYFADHPATGSRIAGMRGTQDPCPRYGR